MSDKPGIDGPLTARQLMWILYAPAVISAVLWLIFSAVPVTRPGEPVAGVSVTENNAEDMAREMEAAADKADAQARAMENSGL